MDDLLFPPGVIDTGHTVRVKIIAEQDTKVQFGMHTIQRVEDTVPGRCQGTPITKRREDGSWVHCLLFFLISLTRSGLPYLYLTDIYHLHDMMGILNFNLVE